ncbi:MAG TPA: histidine kinase [Casimicrobiaceae bacterium]|jgi:hypothetical protein
MHVFRAIITGPSAPSLVALRRRDSATRTPNVARYLRGLTLGRVGIVLLICALFTLRQQSLCVFQMSCGMPDGGTPAGIVRFLARVFLFAVPMLLAVTVVDNATARSGERVRIVALSVAVLLGAAIHGTAFHYTQPPNVLEAARGQNGLFILTYISRALLYGGLATAVLYLFARERDDSRALHETKLAKLALERSMIEARLQALQAQIEPHFLFNTLANVKLLYAAESARAKPLIHELAAYLRAALPQMRNMRSTLARELSLARAYLSILQVRMGQRLKIVIAVAPGLQGRRIAPHDAVDAGGKRRQARSWTLAAGWDDRHRR